MSESILNRQLPDVVAKADNLPSLPTVAIEVLRLSQNEDASLEHLAQVIGQDPALCSKLLRLANSARFVRSQAATTLQQAMSILGMKVVTMMSLSFSLTESLPHEGAKGFDYQRYWHRSLVTAVAAQLLAQRVGSSRCDEAFLCGLLSHIGQLVLGHSASKLYAPVVKKAKGAWPTPQLENEELGFNHTDVGGALLEAWQLPAMIVRPVALVDDEGDEGVREIANLLAVALQATALTCDDAKGEALQRLYAGARALFDLDEATIDTYLVELGPTISDTARMLKMALPEGVGHQEILDQARMQLVELSVAATSELHAAERRASSLEERNKELHDKAHTDALTGLPNRAAFDIYLEREVRNYITRDARGELGLLLLDLDKFKSLNDTLGHQAGDEVLRKIGKSLATITRGSDLCARYGGEEFALIVPSTSVKRLTIMANRVRHAVSSTDIAWAGSKLSVTISVGGACLAKASTPEDAADLIRLADEQLYEAKDAGRDCCKIAPNSIEK